MKARHVPIILILAILIAAALVWLFGGYPPAPGPATSTPVRVTATSTPEPSKTPQNASSTPTATVIPPEPTSTPTAVFPSATPTPEPYEPGPTVTPLPTLAIRGVHRVERGDTLWGIACEWYGDMPLLPGANPLTPCTCWPGIYWNGPQVNAPQLIYPGEAYRIPQECGQ